MDAASAPSGDEIDLAEKLLRRFHLSVPERARLSGGRMRLSALVAAADRYLGTRTLPEGWRPEVADWDGIVIERRDGAIWLHERHEVGQLRYSPARSRKAGDLADAVRAYVRRFGKDGALDGVAIDFDT